MTSKRASKFFSVALTVFLAAILALLYGMSVLNNKNTSPKVDAVINYTSLGNLNDEVAQARFKKAIGYRSGNEIVANSKQMSETPIVVTIGDYDYQAVYKTDGFVTLWMTETYDFTRWDDTDLLTPTAANYANSHVQKFLDSEYEKLIPLEIRQFVQTPQQVAVVTGKDWQSSESVQSANSNIMYTDVTELKDPERPGLGMHTVKKMFTSTYNYMHSNTMSKHLWLPSWYEVYHTGTETVEELMQSEMFLAKDSWGYGGDYKKLNLTNPVYDGGLWNLSWKDRAFDATGKQTEATLAWLRNGDNLRPDRVAVVDYDGKHNMGDIRSDHPNSASCSWGVRPALHMDVSTFPYCISVRGASSKIIESTDYAYPLTATDKTVTLTPGAYPIRQIVDQWGNEISVNGSGTFDYYSYISSTDTKTGVITITLSNVTNHVDIIANSITINVTNNNASKITHVTSSRDALNSATATLSASFSEGFPHVKVADFADISVTTPSYSGTVNGMAFNYTFENGTLTFNITDIKYNDIVDITLDILTVNVTLDANFAGYTQQAQVVQIPYGATEFDLSGYVPDISGLPHGPDKLFIGWTSSKDGGHTYVDAQGKLTGAFTPTLDIAENNFTLFARWVDRTLKVNFVDPVSLDYEIILLAVKVNYGSYPLLSSLTFVYPDPDKVSGYELDNFYHDPEFMRIYDFEAKEPIYETTDVYVKWKPKLFTVTLKANGGEFASGSDSMTLATQCAFDSDVYAFLAEVTFETKPRTGYSVEVDAEGHAIWLESKNEQMYKIKSGFVMPAHDFTVYLSWVKNLYNIVLNSNGGEFASGGDTVTLQMEYESSVINNGYLKNLKDPMRKGFKFKFWTVVPNDRNTQLTTTYSVPEGGMKLYAYWGEALNVTFDDGVNKVTTLVFVGDNINLPGVNPEKEGYIFKGWERIREVKSDGSYVAEDKTFRFPTTVSKDIATTSDEIIFRAKFFKQTSPAEIAFYVFLIVLGIGVVITLIFVIATVRKKKKMRSMYLRTNKKDDNPYL